MARRSPRGPRGSSSLVCARPEAPAQGALYQVVRDHFEPFRAEAGRVHERGGPPLFIEEEFRGSFLSFVGGLDDRDPNAPRAQARRYK